MADDLAEFELANGLRVVFSPRQNSPVVELRLVLEGGFLSDPGELSGLAGLATAMISEGALLVDNTLVSAAFESLGALVHGRVTADAVVLGLSALAANLSDALELYSKAISQITFADGELELVRSSRLELIARERVDPFVLPIRILPSMLFARDRPQARPLSGSGTERGVTAIDRDALHNYYAQRLVPRGGTLIAVGPGNAESLLRILNRPFERWRCVTADSPGLSRSDLPSLLPETAASAVKIVDRPSSSQAAIAVGLRCGPRDSSEAEALMVAEAILSGSFTSRLNVNLREKKGWTYGVRSTLFDARSCGTWMIRSLVDHKRAGAAIAEIASEFENLAGQNPCSPDELTRAVNYLVARIPCMQETCAQIADSLADLMIYRLPLAYYRDLAHRLRRLTPREIAGVCQHLFIEGTPHWIVAGRAAELVDQISRAAVGVVQVEEDRVTGC